MCTVTFLPNGNNFILTSNRDEHYLRKKAAPPRKFNIGKLALFYPKDMQAGGTWIATGTNNFTLCLLNGAFEKHTHQPPYAKSRGLMLLDFFKFNDVEKFVQEYNFEGIEPFTLLLLHSEGRLQLYELKWNGNATSLIKKDETKPSVWSSVTLYEKDIIALRKQWFEQWLENNQVDDMEAIIRFHQFGGNGDATNDILMNRENVLRTVSITSIRKSESELCMKYKDIVDDENFNIRIL